jgi:hypothetical protein
MMNIAYSFKLGYSAAGVTLILGRHEMDMLDAMRAFVRVVETGSFSAVARERHTSQPTISKQVAWLERKLGARLLQRTTRSLSLTEEGRVFAMRAAAAFEAVDEAEASVGPRRGTPSGLVRIGKGAPSPNPGGRPAVFAEIRATAQLEGPACIKKLVEIRDNPNAPFIVQIAACNSLLDRGYGRPLSTAVIAELPPLESPKPITSTMSPDEAAHQYHLTLQQTLGPEQLTDQTSPIIDVEPNKTDAET